MTQCVCESLNEGKIKGQEIVPEIYTSTNGGIQLNYLLSWHNPSCIKQPDTALNILPLRYLV
jgi:hypothetical protein